MRRRIYVASSWRNPRSAAVVQALNHDGHEVYDFRNPAPGLSGFSWSSIDPGWKDWGVGEAFAALRHPVARQGFALDMTGIVMCDAMVLVMPCGRSAHLELGYAAGAGKFTAVLQEEPAEPELMYSMCSLLATSLGVLRLELLRVLCGNAEVDHA